MKLETIVAAATEDLLRGRGNICIACGRRIVLNFGVDLLYRQAKCRGLPARFGDSPL